MGKSKNTLKSYDFSFFKSSSHAIWTSKIASMQSEHWFGFTNQLELFKR